MRWDDLFADLDARVDHERRRDLAAEVADRTEAEVAGIGWQQRATGAPGAVVLRLRDRTRLEGAVRSEGPGWLLLATGRARHGRALVAAAAVVGVQGLGPHSGPPPSGVQARRTLLLALRAVARSGDVVVVRTDAGVLRGRLARVGRDHVDVAEEAHDGVRDGTGQRGVVARWTVPFSALLAVLADDQD